jgi:cytochrome P450
MSRDENLYPNAASFNPDRFLEKTTPDMERKRNPRNFVFGFGRRYVGVFLFFPW